MQDTIQEYRKSVIQHGKESDRVYVIKCAPNDVKAVKDHVNTLAERNGYSKIFIKCRKKNSEPFINDGFVAEAVIPAFFGEDDCLFLSKFTNDNRAYPDREKKELIESVLKAAKAKASSSNTDTSFPEVRELTLSDVSELTKLYKKVFKTYPFPIFDPVYISETMKNHIVYFGIFDGGKLVAAASSETDISTFSVEMTDFATDPDYLGNGAAFKLLVTMEKAMRERSMKTSFTIARSHSYGMNITFAKAGYKFCGTLINNTNISGEIESMNVWYKHLA